MERFGAQAGDALSIHELQHISIAILFFGAGAVGLAIESKAFRNWLASGVSVTIKEKTNPTPPPSYSTSFNPIPALVAALTGLAMSAHHQEYVFAMQIHQLWGYLLVAFGCTRSATYFFLWLRPPASVLPSRPPSEALAAFFLTAGGLVFILSTEQIVFSAMAAGFDDVMTFNSKVLCELQMTP